MTDNRRWVIIVGALVVGMVIAVGLFASRASAQTPAAERGEVVYDKWCTPCHAPGPGHPGTQSLQVKYRGALPAVLEEREDLTPETVRTFVREGILLMAPFRKTEITDAELDDLAAYLTEE
jgi:mono/diheme cytochrome c family protein